MNHRMPRSWGACAALRLSLAALSTVVEVQRLVVALFGPPSGRPTGKTQALASLIHGSHASEQRPEPLRISRRLSAGGYCALPIPEDYYFELRIGLPERAEPIRAQFAYQRR